MTSAMLSVQGRIGQQADSRSICKAAPRTRQYIVTALDRLAGQLPRLVVFNACRTRFVIERTVGYLHQGWPQENE